MEQGDQASESGTGGVLQGGAKPFPEKHRETLTEVVAHVASGSPVKEAARLAGIDPVTLWRWRRDHGEVDTAVRRARAVFLLRQLARVDKGAEKDWKAAAWLLERADPANWGKRLEVEVQTGPRAVVDPLTGNTLGVPLDGQTSDPGQDSAS